MNRPQRNRTPQVILGVDPGTQVSGYGIIHVTDQEYTPIDFGCIRPPANYKLSERYLIIHDSIEKLIEQYKPCAVSVETQFVQKNVQSAIKLGMARGVIMIAAKKKGIPIFEYAPTQAKRAVVGNGFASKTQVQGMVQLLLKLPHPPHPSDAADALALAICHAHASAGIGGGNEI